MDLPLNLEADNINDLVWQMSNALVAEVDGDARLILKLLAGSGWVGGLGTLADFFTRLGEGGLCEGDDLVVNSGNVVTHDGRVQGTENGRGGEERSALLVMLVSALGLAMAMAMGMAVEREWRR